MSSSRGSSHDSTSGGASGPDPRALSQLMLVQTTAYGMTNATQLSEFVCAGVERLPGIHAASMTVEDAVLADGRREADASAQRQVARTLGSRDRTVPPDAAARTLPRECIDLRIQGRTIGVFELEVADAAAFEPYRPYVENLINVVAVIIENQRQQSSLERLTADLQRQVAETEAARQAVERANDTLDARVRTRTADLQRTNSELAAEIEDRRAAERALRESTARLRLAQKAAHMGVWEMELGTGHVRWFEGQAALFGLDASTEELHIDEIRSRIHPDDLAGTIEATEQAGLGGPELDIEFRVIWPDQSVHWLTGRARLVADGNRPPTRLLGVNIDVTARRQLEESLLQAQKLESIGRLAGGVAHDFNNLLTAILGYTDIAADAIPESHAAQQSVKEIREAAVRAGDLTQQLLAFARRQVIAPRVMALNDLVSRVIQMLRPLIGERIELQTDLGADAGSVRIDAGQFTQILMNLAVNARDAMPGGGQLTITTRRESRDVKPGVTQPGPGNGTWAVLTVRDTGTGMPPDVCARVFEPFYTTKTQGRGTGLGLATCYGVVKQSGGEINVFSVVGQGTTFSVWLPADDSARPARSQADPDRPRPGRGEHVLVVEDDESLRRLVTRTLTSAGYNVLEAPDGEAAVDALRLSNVHVDALVTDVVMPRMGGIELAERLAADRFSGGVLFVSGYANADLSPEFLGPTRRLLGKPFSTHDLAAAVRDLLDAVQPARLDGDRSRKAL